MGTDMVTPSQCNVLAENAVATIINKQFVTPVKLQVGLLLMQDRDDDAKAKISSLYRDTYNKLMSGNTEFSMSHPKCQTMNIFAHATETLLNLKYRALYAADTSIIPTNPSSSPLDELFFASTPGVAAAGFGVAGTILNGSIAAGAMAFSVYGLIVSAIVVSSSNADQPNIDTFDAPPIDWNERLKYYP